MNGKNPEQEEWNPALAWDGTRFVYVNPEFLKEEREKLRQMSYGDAADYLMFDSMWSIAFRNSGWERRKDGSRIIYHRERHESCYVEDFHEEASMAQEEDFIIDDDGKKVTYRKTTREWIKRDNGDTKTSGPYHETLRGKKAVDEVTEGLRNAILGSR